MKIKKMIACTLVAALVVNQTSILTYAQSSVNGAENNTSTVTKVAEKVI